jgi:site-specific recombinase XerD
MSIFKKASVAPIVKTVISQGLDDYYHPDPTIKDTNLSDRVNESYLKPTLKDRNWAEKQLIYELRQNHDHDYANFVEDMMNKGYGFQQIRDMLSSIRLFFPR